MMLRCAKCKRQKDEGDFRQIGWKLDRVTPRFHSYCLACHRKLDNARYANPEYAAVRRIKRKQRYVETGK